jgi:NAD(P)-dependent dehydrogenase (short-subunit alcohol dehydrogenase family)
MPNIPNYPEFKDTSVLITGGGSGIGAALTEGFIAQGAKVAFIDIDQANSTALCDALESQYSNRPLYINADLSNADAIKGAVAHAVGAHGAVKVLVNNAAWDDRHEIADVDVAYWDRNTAINLRHQFFTIQAVVDGMKAMGGGAIVNFTSTSYMLNIGDMPAYTASKAGIVGLTKGMAGKLGPHGIRVNAIAPGWIMTQRQKDLWVTKESLDAMLDKQCLKHPLQPDEMIGPCLFLASNAASAVTAQTLIADGGLL